MDTKILMQKVLDLAVQGKLVTQNPKDEPASVLLERIRKEKARMVKDGLLKKGDIQNDTVIFVGDDGQHYEKFADGTIKCIEEEIPFDTPNGWTWCRLIDIILFVRNGITIKQNKDCRGYPITRIETISDGTIDRSKFGYADIFDKSLYESYILKNNDILLSHINSPKHLGKCALYKKENNEIVIHGMNLLCLRAINLFSPEYLMIFLRSKFFKSFVQDNMQQAVNQASIPSKSIGKVLTPFPPLEEQKRIGFLIANIQQKISLMENDGRSIKELSSLTKSKVLDLAIRGQLVLQYPTDEPASVLLERIRASKEKLIKGGKVKRDRKESIIYRRDNSYYELINGVERCINEEVPFDIPDNWEWVRLGTIISISSGDGLTSKEMNNSGYYPVYGGNGISGYHNAYNVKKKTLVIGRVGFYCGSTHVTEGKAWVTDNAFVVTFDENNLNMMWLKFYIDYLEPRKKASSTAQPVISGKLIYPMLIPIPPLAEQNRIVEKIEEIIPLMESL